MGFNCGIVGLPNVGKSTLFNALTATQAAEAANYPFCTIEPNIGRVAVPDERLEVCARLAKSAKIVPTQLEFVDIAGLVRGASKGEGLGNQFLGHIRAVDAIAHVLRCFADGNVTHVEGSLDPARDAETVETELLLADLESLDRRIKAAEKKARGNDKEAKAQLVLMERAQALLADGKPARSLAVAPESGSSTSSRFLRRAQGVACLDGGAGHQGAAGRGRDPHRFREGLYPRRNHRLCRFRRLRRRAGREGSGQDAARRLGVCRRRRRHSAFPLQSLALAAMIARE